ncbi:hypothetical protein GCM10009759_04270 [Kitasatospora saccharophila]|uniref:Uncharacterized protein n=1 Tax=Kitasatospora saccharophila TaxID=407973 RepID=A0ABN2W6B6_9ACTN
MPDPTIWVAGVGVAGTLAGSALTGFLAARTERRKTEAAERQAERQQASADLTRSSERRVEHLRWRRDRRQAAYAAFLLSLGEISQLSSEGMILHAQGIPDRDRAEVTRNAITAALKDGNTKLATVRLEGPRPLADAALAFHEHVSFVGQWVRNRLTDDRPASTHAREHVHLTSQVKEKETEFLEEAEKALAELMDAD